MFNVCDVLQKAREQAATDVFLKAGEVPRIGRGGKMEFLDFRKISGDDILECLLYITDEEQRNRLAENGHCTVAYTGTSGERYRVSVFRSQGAITMVFRILLAVARIKELAGAETEKVRQIAEISKGLVLFAGEAGSGRTHAMAAVAEAVSEQRAVHVMTLENPVEILLSQGSGPVNQRELGEDFSEYYSAIESACREKVDVLLCDGYGSENLLTQWNKAKSAGMLVLATVYGNSLSEVVENLSISWMTSERARMRKALSELLQAVVFCRWTDGLEGRRQQWEILTVDEAVKNKICNS